jgi:hypothetical protein
MGDARAAGVMLAWMVGGCVAYERAEEERAGEQHDGVTEGVTAVEVEALALTDPRDAQASRGCDGAPLPICDGTFTGATCDLPCTGKVGPSACGLRRTCHSDGSTYGLSTRNTVLYPASPEDADAAVEADFEAWIAEHPADLGLPTGFSVGDVELHRLGDFRSSAGPLTIFRFTQTYHGMPVLAPDGIVTLVYGPKGAVAMTGAIIDGRASYDHRQVQATAAHAVRSMLAHASAYSGVPAGKLEVVHATPVAMPMRRAIGWAGFVRSGGASVARVIVDADPSFTGAILPLWSYREAGVAGLGDTQTIQAHALATTGDLTSLAYADQTTLTTGAPLLGSVDDVSLEIQLATDRVVLLDLHGALEDDLVTSATRVLDPAGDFLANSGTELSAQTAYHLFQSWYDFIDQHLTEPVSGTKRWDSANLVYSNGMSPGDAPPGTYAPRVLAFVNANSADCSVTATACAKESGYRADNPEAMEFPELAHIPPGASKQETTGTMMLLGEGIEPVTFAHEFGHVIDLFAGGGITIDLAPGCGGPCTYECVENTTDEAPPLTETIAQLLAFVLLRQSFDGVDWQQCSIVDMVSRGGSMPWTPGPCIPAGEDITDCTLLLPAQCPVGATGSSGGMGTGTARPVPTGMCDHRQGYGTNSLFQAFWQMLNGQRCDPTSPFACVSASWGAGVDPMDASTDALLYALRVNSLTYEDLFDAMAMYVSCTYGPDAYEEFNAIACNHGIRDCAAQAPLVCEDCGNGVREGSETCDGNDWLYTGCDDLPEYSGGALTCDQSTCMLDESLCIRPGLDTTAGTITPDESTTAPGVEPEPGIDTDPGASGAGSGGCDCRAGASGEAWLILFPISLLGARRRRRAA